MSVVNASERKFGWKASNFNLLSVDNKYYTLESLRNINGLVVVFICNHCPYVISIAERLSYEANELQKININTAAIMSNDVSQYIEDSYENMKLFSNKYNFNFQYLYDESQNVAKEYQAVCTPDFFGFNKNLELCYRGRIDSGVMKKKNNKIERDLFNAMKMISLTNKGPKIQNNSFGCSIKWKDNT